MFVGPFLGAHIVLVLLVDTCCILYDTTLQLLQPLQLPNTSELTKEICCSADFLLQIPTLPDLTGVTDVNLLGFKRTPLPAGAHLTHWAPLTHWWHLAALRR